MSINEEQLEFENTGELPPEQVEYLKTLEAEEDPEGSESEQAATEEQAMDEQTAQMTAVMGLGTIEWGLKRFVHPDFEFTTDTKLYAVENLGPVLIKYGALLPVWLSTYGAEIKAAMAVGKLASEGMDKVSKLKAIEANARANHELRGDE